jgi:hypothetical protein
LSPIATEEDEISTESPCSKDFSELQEIEVAIKMAAENITKSFFIKHDIV